MTGNETTWTLDTLVWLPLCALIVAGLIALAVYLRRRRETAGYYDMLDAPTCTFLSWASFVVAFLFVAGTALGFYPYSAEYHQWRPVEGTVAQIDNRLIGTGGGMETKFVVRFAGNDQQYGCDDTRCASVRPGDFLALSCKRAWQFTGTDGYDCRFYGTEAAS